MPTHLRNEQRTKGGQQAVQDLVCFVCGALDSTGATCRAQNNSHAPHALLNHTPCAEMWKSKCTTRQDGRLRLSEICACVVLLYYVCTVHSALELIKSLYTWHRKQHISPCCNGCAVPFVSYQLENVWYTECAALSHNVRCQRAHIHSQASFVLVCCSLFGKRRAVHRLPMKLPFVNCSRVCVLLLPHMHIRRIMFRILLRCTTAHSTPHTSGKKVQKQLEASDALRAVWRASCGWRRCGDRTM